MTGHTLGRQLVLSAARDSLLPSPAASRCRANATTRMLLAVVKPMHISVTVEEGSLSMLKALSNDIEGATRT